MTTLHVSRLKATLDRARKAGHAEEVATIAGLHLVFSSLGPNTYAEILHEVTDLEEAEFLMAYQVEHVCRSLVEIDETDFRGVEFVEDVVLDKDGNPTPVKLEVHQWIKDNIVSTWSREMVGVAYHKVMDAEDAASVKSREGVVFRVEPETDEDKFHRLLTETQAVGTELPDDMREAILKEHGLLVAASQEELAAVNEQAKAWLNSEAEVVEEPEVQVPVVPAAAPQVSRRVTPEVRAPQQLVESVAPAFSEPEVPEVVAPPMPTPQPVPLPKDPREMLARRQPLNRTPIAPPIPQTARTEHAAVAANPRPPRPPESAMAEMPLSRAAQLAALEKEAAAQGVPFEQMDGVYDLTGEGPVLEERLNTALDKSTLVVNRPPVVGRNVKYVDAQKLGINPRNR